MLLLVRWHFLSFVAKYSQSYLSIQSNKCVKTSNTWFISFCLIELLNRTTNASLDTSFFFLSFFLCFCSFRNYRWCGHIKLINFYYLIYWIYVSDKVFSAYLFCEFLSSIVFCCCWSMVKSLFQPYCFIGLLVAIVKFVTQLNFNHFGIQFKSGFLIWK